MPHICMHAFFFLIKYFYQRVSDFFGAAYGAVGPVDFNSAVEPLDFNRLPPFVNAIKNPTYREFLTQSYSQDQPSSPDHYNFTASDSRAYRSFSSQAFCHSSLASFSSVSNTSAGSPGMT